MTDYHYYGDYLKKEEATAKRKRLNREGRKAVVEKKSVGPKEI